MANRQYIGARYVPKFYEGSNGTDWDAGIAYEPLTVVTYLGNSYTSKKIVPSGVGDPLHNSEYWASTGLYNTQVEEYRQEVVALQADVDAINSPTLRNMSERKFVFIGDSYTQVPTAATSFVGKVAQYLGLDISQYHNIGVSGVDMNGFINEVDTYAYSDGNEITDVVVTGGINDAHTAFGSSTLRTTIPTLLTKIKTKFPNAIIWAGFSGGGYYTNPTLTADYPNFNYVNVQNIKFLWEDEFAKEPKVIYMNGLDEWQRYLGDTDIYSGGSGLHPMGYGLIVLAENIANYLKGGGPVSKNLTIGDTVVFPFAVSGTSAVGGNVTVRKYGEYEEVRFPWRGINLANNVSLSGADLIIYEYTLDPNTEVIAVANNTSVKIAAPLGYMTSDEPTTQKVASAVYEFVGTKVKVCVPSYVAPVTNVSSLWIPDLHFRVPANAI